MYHRILLIIFITDNFPKLFTNTLFEISMKLKALKLLTNMKRNSDKILYDRLSKLDVEN